MLTNLNINLTDNALKKIASLGIQHDSVLRIAVSGGGCSGFKYNFLIDQISYTANANKDDDDEYDEEDDDDDDDDDEFDEDEDYEDYESSSCNKDLLINDNMGNPVLMIDSHSAKFLNGSVIDYVEDLSGSGFQIKSNIAKSQCGCGNSFSV